MKLKQALLALVAALLFAGPVILVHGLVLTAAAAAALLLFYFIFCGLRFWLKDEFNALLSLLLFWVIASFLPQPLPLLITLLMLLPVISALYNDKKLVRLDWQRLMRLTLFDKAAWYLVFLLVIPLGFFSAGGFSAFDTIHPINDLSVGGSYSFSLFNAPDLSFAGGQIKTYFLGSRLPYYWANLFNLPLLTAAFLITPLVFLLLLALLLTLIFEKYPRVKTPVFWLFFLPLFSFHLYHYQGFGLHYLFHSYTYSLAYLLGIFALASLAEGKRARLVFLSLLLLLTKISFFAPVLAGIVLFHLRKLEIKKLVITLAFLLPLSLVLYKVFVSGSHSHNLWLFFPSLLAIKFPEFLTTGQIIISKPRLVTTIIPLVVFSAVVYCYFKEARDNLLRSCASIALAGMLIPLALTEVVELNSIFFYVAVFFPAALLTCYVFGRWIALLGRGRRYLLIAGLSVLVIISAYFSTFRASLLNLAPSKPLSYTTEFMAAYDWLRQNTPKDSLVLFSKHYESSAVAWEESTTFIRSSLSSRQMFLEGGYYRGLVMKPDFSARFADVIFFYKNFVELSAASRPRINYFFGKSFARDEPKPLAQYGGLIAKLSFGKQWSGLNIGPRFEREVRADLKRLSRLSWFEKKEWLDDFIKTAGIDYIVLEKGDRPGRLLKQLGREVFRDKTITILEVKSATDRS